MVSFGVEHNALGDFQIGVAFDIQIVSIHPRVDAEEGKPLDDAGNTVGLFETQLFYAAKNRNAARMGGDERKDGDFVSRRSDFSAGTSHP